MYACTHAYVAIPIRTPLLQGRNLRELSDRELADLIENMQDALQVGAVRCGAVSALPLPLGGGSSRFLPWLFLVVMFESGTRSGPLSEHRMLSLQCS